jgi:hypothetical protein
MAHRLKTPEGRKVYALRKQTPEPVFGIIKSAIGYRQFSLRGLDKARGEWSLVTMAWNIKRSLLDPVAACQYQVRSGKMQSRPLMATMAMRRTRALDTQHVRGNSAQTCFLAVTQPFVSGWDCL